MQILEHYRKTLLNSDGDEVEKDDVYDYALQPDGSEKPVRPFDMTKVIYIPDENWVSTTTMDDFLITNVYEIYAKDKKGQRQLFEEAEKRLKDDKVGLTNWSFGRGYLQYYAFLEPVISQGKFVWLMKLTDTKVEYKHMQEVPAEVKVPVKERPTLETLPPVQALVAAAKQR
ncbi:MAG: hypothetical protein U9O89_06605 [Thermoproteota archaeon]|nr:hypothetical protein [Thermoproteota archaeon]